MKKVDLMLGINLRGTYLTYDTHSCTHTQTQHTYLRFCQWICVCVRSKMVIPHLLKSRSPHILNLAPPINLNPIWFKNHTGNHSNQPASISSCTKTLSTHHIVFFVAYTMAKYGMSMCVLGMAEEFRGQIAVNALWPRTGWWLHVSMLTCFSQTHESNSSVLCVVLQ